MPAKTWKFLLRWVPILGIGSLTLTATAQRNTNAWARNPAFRNTNAMWATIHTFTVTNETSPGVFVVTNIGWRSNITFTNWTTNAIGNNWTQLSMRWTNGVRTNFAYTISDSKTLTRTNMVQTWQDQIQLDCALALDERRRNITYFDGSIEYGLDSTRWFFTPYDNLVNLKAQLAAMTDFFYVQLFNSAPAWVNEPALSNHLAAGTLYATNWMGLAWSASPGLTWSADTNNYLWVAAAVPSNYITYTAPRDLFATNSYYRHTMTCLVTFAQSFAGSRTSVVEDCCGTTNRYTFVGTNRQVFTLVCTNDNIAAGSTLADYNYYGFYRMITNLTALVMGSPFNQPFSIAAYGVTNEAYRKRGIATTTNNISQALTDALANLDADGGATNFWSVGGPIATIWESSYTYYSTNMSGGNLITEARASAVTNRALYSMWRAPDEHRAILYAAGSSNMYDAFGYNLISGEYNDMETGLEQRDNGSVVAYRTNVVAAGSTQMLFEVVGVVKQTNWSTASGKYRGIGFNLPLVVSWPKPTTNGFRFK